MEVYQTKQVKDKKRRIKCKIAPEKHQKIAIIDVDISNENYDLL